MTRSDLKMIINNMTNFSYCGNNLHLSSWKCSYFAPFFSFTGSISQEGW